MRMKYYEINFESAGFKTHLSIVVASLDVELEPTVAGLGNTHEGLVAQYWDHC